MLCIAFLNTGNSYAQRCATVEYQKLRHERIPQLESEAEFERWIKEKIEQKKAAIKNGTAREEATVYTIPVVIHVIHNGEPLGIGMNIPEGQILSQIDVLTEDFRRTNADASNTPAMFLPVASDVELEFALAQRDPEGLPTSGIVRVNGGRSEWDLVDNYTFKSLSFWPPEEYLNIWVTDLSGSYLGYAQFPSSDMLSGLETASESRSTDGVVIDYRAFGSVDKYPAANVISSYNLGRTTTHEVGHFFGLRHIWGDDSGGCSLSDYIDDTPNQGGSTSGCPGTIPSSCSSTDMIQNYMDYTDDVCMNIFTEDQKTRMRIVLDNSIRRASLRTSKGAVPPVVVSNDVGIRNVITPLTSSCVGAAIPTLQIRNYGNNTVTSARITIQINGGASQSTTFPLNLAPLEIDTVEFTAIDFNTTGDHTIIYEVTMVNGVTDGNADNNLATTSVNVPETVSIPLEENFNTLTPGQIPDKWKLLNPDGQQTWEVVENAPNGEISNTALFVNFYDYEIEGDYDTLLTPALDLSTATFAILSFDRAYAKYPQIDSEGLIIKLSTDCGQTYEHTLFEAYGDELATVQETPSYYVPAGLSDWKKECLILDEFLGNPNVRIAFISKNGYGNNLYIDNIAINDSDNSSDRKDLGIVTLSQPSKVVCAQRIAPAILIKNQGCTIENQLTLNYQFDGTQLNSDTFINLNLKPGQTKEITLSDLLFDLGEHTYNFELIDDNDINPDNNRISGIFHVNNETDQAPVKENFEDFGASEWVTISNDENFVAWDIQKTNKGTSLFLTGSGQEGWLVSPVLDMNGINEATLSFDLAYSYEEGSKDGLTILVSTNCGISYDEEIFSRFGEALNTGDFSSTPQNDSVWSTITVNMSEYIDENELRIAFIVAKDGFNNIYLDNIQTFVTSHLVSNINEIYPNPAPNGIFNITFDLPEKETVQVTMYDTRGQKLSETTFLNTLNQTYRFDHSDKQQGIYLVKVVGKSFSYTKRIFLQP